MTRLPRPVALVAVADALRDRELLVATRGDVEGTIRAVSRDSRKMGEDALFLAWEGHEHDAHRFVEDAVEGGAVAAVVERFVEGAEIPQLQVADGRRGAAVAAARLFGLPEADLDLVGVTGTNGKTTTVLLTRHLLAGAEPAGALGTLGVTGPDGDVWPGTERLTTPGPVEVATHLRSLLDAGVRTAVLEASSHALDQGRLDGVFFEAGVFTNLSREHLDYHGDFEAYRAAKARLVDRVQVEGTVVVNGDEAAWDALDLSGRRRLSFGLAASADLRARELRLGPEGSRFRVEGPGGIEASVRLPLLGRFNVENALAALGAALALERGLEEAAERLATAPQMPGRLQVVVREPFTVVIDFAHTPDALARVLASLRALAPGRLTVLFGAGGDRDRTKRPHMGRVAAEGADRIVVTSDNPRTEDPERIVEEVAEGVGEVPHERIVDRREAIHRVLEEAEEGEIVLLAGKGHETYQVVGTERRPFDEARIVREYLDRRGTKERPRRGGIPS